MKSMLSKQASMFETSSSSDSESDYMVKKRSKRLFEKKRHKHRSKKKSKKHVKSKKRRRKSETSSESTDSTSTTEDTDSDSNVDDFDEDAIVDIKRESVFEDDVIDAITLYSMNRIETFLKKREHFNGPDVVEPADAKDIVVKITRILKQNHSQVIEPEIGDCLDDLLVVRRENEGLKPIFDREEIKHYIQNHNNHNSFTGNRIIKSVGSAKTKKLRSSRRSESESPRRSHNGSLDGIERWRYYGSKEYKRKRKLSRDRSLSRSSSRSDKYQRSYSRDYFYDDDDDYDDQQSDNYYDRRGGGFRKQMGRGRPYWFNKTRGRPMFQNRGFGPRLMRGRGGMQRQFTRGGRFANSQPQFRPPFGNGNRFMRAGMQRPPFNGGFG